MIAEAVARYGTRFHRVLAGEHAVGSPLGAWLLLALVAPSVSDARSGPPWPELLGCPPGDAFAAARALLADPHPAVAAGAAVWHDERVACDALLSLVQRLAPPADAGPVPSQAEADAWAARHTLGLIDRFPLAITDRTRLVLATALATRVSWQVPYALAAPDSLVLPARDGFAGVPLLRDAGGSEWQGIVDTAAGRLAVHAAQSADGLLVVSAAGDGEPAAVLDAAQAVGREIAADTADGVPLVELPLGDGPAWHVTERVVESGGAPHQERYEAIVPAWEARSDHDLTATPELGFPAALRGLIGLLPTGDYDAQARQAALARYTREGFEAAAVTAIGVRAAAAVVGRQVTVRTARLEFTRPHAVVALARGGPAGWDGLPVFSAWVTHAAPAR